MSASHCPLWKQTREAMSSVRALATSLRKLRPMIRRCRRCPERETCPIWRDFNAQFQAALEEVVDEWQLASGR